MANREVSTLEVRLTGDVQEALSGLNKVGQRAQKLGKQMRRTGYQLSRQFTAPLAGAGVALVGGAAMASEFADEIDKMSVRTGIARERLQELRFAGDQLGVGFEAIEKGVEAISRRLPQFESGTGNVAEAWQSLGVDLRDAEGELRPMGKLFPEVIDALSGMENETRRNAIAMQLFGRRGGELIPILEAGEGRMGDLMDRARDLGIVMSDEQVGAWVEFKDQVAEVGEVLRAAAIEIASSFLPLLKDRLVPLFRDHVAPLLSRIGDFVEQLNPQWIEMAAAVGTVLAAAGPLILAGGKIVGMLGLILSPAGAVVAALAALTAGAVHVAQNWEEFRVIGTKIWMQIQRVVLGAVDKLLGALETLTSFVPKLGDKIAEARRKFEAFADEAIAGSLESLEEHERALAANADEADQLADDTARAGREADGATEATDRYADALDRASSSAEDLEDQLGDLSVQQQRIFEDIGRRVFGEDLLPSDEFGRLSEDIDEGRISLRGFREEGEDASETGEEAADTMGGAFERSVSRSIQNFESLEQVAGSILDSIKSQLIDTLVSGLFTAITGGSGGLLSGLLGGIFGGGRQHGGLVQPGRAFVVGEAGPELFVPQSAGRVVPDVAKAAAAGAAGGGERTSVHLEVDPSRLPEPISPREAARDRAWLELLLETEKNLKTIRGEQP